MAGVTGDIRIQLLDLRAAPPPCARCEARRGEPERRTSRKPVKHRPNNSHRLRNARAADRASVGAIARPNARGPTDHGRATPSSKAPASTMGALTGARLAQWRSNVRITDSIRGEAARHSPGYAGTSRAGSSGRLQHRQTV